jgi:hypothetical protein
MSFGIIDHVDDLKRTLEGVSPQRRVAFGVFCCEPMVVSACVNAPDSVRVFVPHLQRVLEAAWRFAAGDGAFQSEAFRASVTALYNVDWPATAFPNPTREVEFEESVEAALALAEVVLTGSALGAASVAERVINFLDCAYDTTNETLASHPVTGNEIQRQRAIERWALGITPADQEIRARFGTSFAGLPPGSSAGA